MVRLHGFSFWLTDYIKAKVGSTTAALKSLILLRTAPGKGRKGGIGAGVFVVDFAAGAKSLAGGAGALFIEHPLG